MAIATGSTPTGSAQSAAGAHAYMVALRNYLVAVGLEELDIPNAYDTSEEGTAAQIPTGTISSPQYSPWSHFAFTDTLQSTYPVVVSFCIRYGDAFNDSKTSGNYRYPRYTLLARVSSGVDLDGVPVDWSLAPFPTGRSGASTENYVVNKVGAGLGDFIRYTGDSLTVILGLESHALKATFEEARPFGFLYLERTQEGDVCMFPLSGGSGQFEVQEVWCTTNSAPRRLDDLQDRAGGELGLTEDGAAVVAPIYYHHSTTGIRPLKRVFTAPKGIGNNGEVLTLDFTGEEGRYLVVHPGHVEPTTPNACWLYEWE